METTEEENERRDRNAALRMTKRQRDCDSVSSASPPSKKHSKQNLPNDVVESSIESSIEGEKFDRLRKDKDSEYNLSKEINLNQNADIISTINMREDGKYNDACWKSCEELHVTDGRVNKNACKEPNTLDNACKDLNTTDNTPTSTTSLFTDELNNIKQPETLYVKSHSQDLIPDLKRDQMISSSDKLPSCSSVTRNMSSLSVTHKLNKSVSEDSLDQDISQTDSWYQETRMTESGDFSNISGTECESLTSSLYLPRDDSGFLTEQQSSISKSLPSLSKIEGSVSSITDTTTRRERKKKKNKRSRNSSKKSATSTGIKNEAQGANMENLRPNYFVGVQISNADLHKAIIKVQEDLVGHDEFLRKALVDVATSHLTLLVAHLDTEEAVQLASKALEKCGNRVKEDLSACPLKLTFKGVGHFSHQVVYAQLVEDDHYHRLLDLGECVRSVFAESQVCMPDTRVLFPHFTIAKLSKLPRIKGKHGPRRIDSASYSNHMNTNFGCQTVAGLQLLAMNKPKDQNRYFYNSAQVLFDFRVQENTDHSMCCFPRRPLMDPNQMKVYRRPYSTAAENSTPAENSIAAENFTTAEEEEKAEDKGKTDGNTSEPGWFLPTLGVLTAVAAGFLFAVILPRIRNR